MFKDFTNLMKRIEVVIKKIKVKAIHKGPLQQVSLWDYFQDPNKSTTSPREGTFI